MFTTFCSWSCTRYDETPDNSIICWFPVLLLLPTGFGGIDGLYPDGFRRQPERVLWHR